MEPDQKEFLLREFDALRRQMEQDIRQIGDLLRFAVLASGAIWAWLLSQAKPDCPPTKFSLFISIIPLLITVAFGVFVRQLRAFIKTIGEYIQTVEEKKFALPAWQSYFQEHGAMVGTYETGIWWSLGIVNVIGAVLYFFTFFRICPK
jgi:hypothetical protein